MTFLVALMLETENTSVTLVNFSQDIRCNNPEDNHLKNLQTDLRIRDIFTANVKPSFVTLKTLLKYERPLLTNSNEKCVVSYVAHISS
jgi:hypothetical protein